MVATRRVSPRSSAWQGRSARAIVGAVNHALQLRDRRGAAPSTSKIYKYYVQESSWAPAEPARAVSFRHLRKPEFSRMPDLDIALTVIVRLLEVAKAAFDLFDHWRGKQGQV